ncbi:ABC transporter permease [Actinoplanes sp. KI2]|uniref:ABC transporter permease n=1 Tax=Actinoplanes sp. KI2 TaxID=2983315 RepID=UPI0021D5B14E|nr:ABC transporter permease [Actinoplanes sp. KI2]MCU7724568.1 ABC transporter permease [Actinoplanes sp. KI2]
MTAATAVRSAYPPAIADLMPRAIELAKTTDGDLPSRNRLMKDLHIGDKKAKAVLAELTAIAEKDANRTDHWRGMVARGSLAERPPLTLVPDAPADAEPVADASPQALPDASAPAENDASHPLAQTTHTSTDVTSPGAEAEPVAAPQRRPVTWPVLILCLPAFVAIWGGWVEMGRLTGFGKVTLLPGIADHFQLNTAITLPIGVETYAAYALFVWLSGRATGDARKFAKRSAIASLLVGAFGQIAYHLMNAWGWTSAPWPITAFVSCIPVAVLGMGAALAHLMHK